MKIAFAPPFFRQLKRLEKDLQEEVFEKIELFEQEIKNPSLKVHKLKGRLDGRYSFSVNYKIRIVFQYLSTQEVVFLAVGDHDVYKI